MHAILFDVHVMHEYFLKFWCEMGVRLPLLVHMEVGVSRLCKGYGEGRVSFIDFYTYGQYDHLNS